MLVHIAILLGDSGVGKSNICLRFAKNEFCESTLTTVGVEFIVKDMVVDNKRITIQVWDTGALSILRYVY